MAIALASLTGSKPLAETSQAMLAMRAPALAEEYHRRISPIFAASGRGPGHTVGVGRAVSRRQPPLVVSAARNSAPPPSASTAAIGAKLMSRGGRQLT